MCKAKGLEQSQTPFHSKQVGRVGAESQQKENSIWRGAVLIRLKAFAVGAAPLDQLAVGSSPQHYSRCGRVPT